mmetsp:Transcript_1113/g.1637  ORF Transcript_1113/g.1637 Transcript_1113/m.1637 type:complete len:462 (-) Transcript_1113:624-2009(-)
MTSVSMMPVTLPRFAPPAPKQRNPSQTSQAAVWAAANGDYQNGSDSLDFDILAEYLLDDSAASGLKMGLPQFDFSDVTNGSGVVSPEQSEDGSPYLDNAFVANQGAPVASTMSIAANAVSYAAPGPIPPQHPVLAPVPPQSGMPMPPAPAVSSFPSLPAAIPTQMPSSHGVVVHQHASLAVPATIPPNAKRRRVNGTAPPIANGQIVTGRGRQKSQAQIDRRRERNRILARRTRLRKKFFFEGLQKEVIELQRENSVLKDLVRKELPPELSKKLLEESKAMEQLPSAVHEAVGENATDMNSQDFSLVRSIQSSQQCFIITDPSLQDNPIVYASDDFLTLTGYERGEVLGRNCRFLQGTETGPQKVEQVRKAISLGEDTTVTFINYTKDGTAFWNKLFIAALRDAQNNIVNFIGVIAKVASPDQGDPEAGKRVPGEESTPSNGDEDEDETAEFEVDGGEDAS